MTQTNPEVSVVPTQADEEVFLWLRAEHEKFNRRGDHGMQRMIEGIAARLAHQTPPATQPSATVTQEDHRRAAEIMRLFQLAGTRMHGGEDYQLLLRQLALHREEATLHTPPPVATATVVDAARPFSEWHEDHGEVLWWKLPVAQAPYVGSPLDLGRGMKVVVQIGFEEHDFPMTNTGGWPFDEEDEPDLWWTPLPKPTFFRASPTPPAGGR